MRTNLHEKYDYPQARRAQAAQDGMVHHAAQRPHAARGGSNLKNHRTGLRGKGIT